MKKLFLFLAISSLFNLSTLFPMHRIRTPYKLALRCLSAAREKNVSFPVTLPRTVTYLDEIEGKPAMVYRSGTLQLTIPEGVQVREVEQQHIITPSELTTNYGKLCSCIRQVLASRIRDDVAQFSGENTDSNWSRIPEKINLLPHALQLHYNSMILDMAKNQPCDTDSHGVGSEMQIIDRGNNNQTVTEYITTLFLTKPDGWKKKITEQKKQIAQTRELLRITNGKAPHEILGVPQDAKPEDAQKAYYQMRLASEGNKELENTLRQAFLNLSKKHQ